MIEYRFFSSFLFLAILTLLSFGTGPVLKAQNLQPHFRQFTTEDGLPSSEIYFIFQDQDCFLWFGTDNGIARYDGYEFQVFDSNNGLEDVVIFSMRESPSGEKWVSTYSGRVYQFTDGGFQPFRYNDRLIELKTDYLILTLLDVDAHGNLVVHIVNRGILRINQQGDSEWLTPNQDAIYNYTYRSQSQRCRNQNIIPYSYSTRSPKQEVKRVFEFDTQSQAWEEEGKYHLRSPGVKMAFFDQSDLLLAAADSLYLIEQNGQPQRTIAPLRNLTLGFPHAERGWFFGSDNGGGLQYLLWNGEKRVIRRDTLLKKHSISFGLYDHQGGLWVASLDAGVFYAARPELRTFSSDQGLSESKALSIALVGDTAFYAGFADGAVQYHHMGQNVSRDVVPRSPNIKPFSIFYDSIRQQLYTNNYRIDVSQSATPAFRAGGNPRISSHEYTPLLNLADNPSDPTRRLFFTLGSSFGVVDLDQQHIINYCGAFQALGKPLGTHHYHIDLQGRHWLGTLNGLYRLTAEQQLVFDTLGHPALAGRVQCITSMPPESVLFGTRGQGIIQYTPDSLRQIDIRDGLASNMIRDFHQSGSGDLWVATLSGLSRVSFAEDGRLVDLRTFHTAHGLPSNEIHDMDSRSGKIWLATSNGIAEFTEPPRQRSSAPPCLRGLSVNGTPRAVDSLLTFPHYGNDVLISFSTINYRMAGGIPYRYRLQADEAWQETRQPFVNFTNLSPGDYRFEVQSQNQDLVWSDSLLLSFDITPPWYQRWYVYVLGPILIALGIGAYFRARERIRRKEQNLQRQLLEMEWAALHAQMNPHFIYNCLNSIQQFILTHDEKRAVKYLVQFAQLIRDTLKVSVRGKHSLAEELAMLKNYLALEKLRFKEDFNYFLEVDADLDPERIQLPSLLIQPFVENAIQHGLENGERAGEVRIHFAGTAELLEVRIRDNGRGFDPHTAIRSDAMGVDITRRRLQLLNQQSSTDQPMQLRTLYHPDGSIAGTEICIRVSTQFVERSTP